MHSFTHNLLPFSFRGTWITNRERIPERELRNADQLYVPQHNYETVKRMPLFNFLLYEITSLILTNLIQDNIFLSKKMKKALRTVFVNAGLSGIRSVRCQKKNADAGTSPLPE
jgi:hypothetical protein